MTRIVSTEEQNRAAVRAVELIGELDTSLAQAITAPLITEGRGIDWLEQAVAYALDESLTALLEVGLDAGTVITLMKVVERVLYAEGERITSECHVVAGHA